MKKFMKYTFFLLGILVLNMSAFSQFRRGVSDISIAAQNVEWGVPFIQVSPVHPGLELGITLLENVKEKSIQGIGLDAGYFYHDIIAQGFYTGARYAYQYQIGDFGLDASAGAGGLWAVYAGDGYTFNEEAGEWEQGLYDKLFFQAHMGLGLSFIRSASIQPFIAYDLRMLQNVYNMVSHLKVGVRINL